MRKIFIDTNILIDLILEREGYVAAAKVLALTKKPGWILIVSVLTMANIAYILRKTLRGEKLYAELSKISSLLCVESLTKEDFERAVSLKAKDFEDALQYCCAKSVQCEVIVTRNKKDFLFEDIQVLTPEELNTIQELVGEK